MGLETSFKVFAVDNTGKHRYTKEQIKAIWNEEQKHELAYSSSMAGEERAALDPTMPSFLRVRGERI